MQKTDVHRCNVQCWLHMDGGLKNNTSALKYCVENTTGRRPKCFLPDVQEAVTHIQQTRGTQ